MALDDALIRSQPPISAGADGLAEDVVKLRARIRAIEVVVAELIADMLAQNPDPPATANAALLRLMGALETAPMPEGVGEERRFRDLTKYAAFDLLQRAIERLAE